MERGLRAKTNPIDDYIGDYDYVGSEELAQQIYNMILEDYEFSLIPYHTDREYAHYFDKKLMKIYNPTFLMMI